MLASRCSVARVFGPRFNKAFEFLINEPISTVKLDGAVRVVETEDGSRTLYLPGLMRRIIPPMGLLRPTHKTNYTNTC
jgi:hypothetical protein